MNLLTYNQVSIPSFIYGTAWKKEATSLLVQQAVVTGFKAIDTANQLIHYQEALVGDALLALRDKGIMRESLFLQTKFTSVNGQDERTPYNASAPLATQVNQSFDSSLAHLHTDYIDSYVLHGPYYRNGLGDEDWEVWAAIEEIYQSKKVRMIGISNVTAAQLTELCAKAKYRPMVVQNRCYASMEWDKEVRDICNTYGILYQGFSLLTANGQVMAHPFVRETANRLGCDAAQVIFSFASQIGMIPLTGTTAVEHMQADLETENLHLLQDDIDRIEKIAV